VSAITLLLLLHPLTSVIVRLHLHPSTLHTHICNRALPQQKQLQHFPQIHTTQSTCPISVRLPSSAFIASIELLANFLTWSLQHLALVFHGYGLTRPSSYFFIHITHSHSHNKHNIFLKHLQTTQSTSDICSSPMFFSCFHGILLMWSLCRTWLLSDRLPVNTTVATIMALLLIHITHSLPQQTTLSSSKHLQTTQSTYPISARPPSPRIHRINRASC